MWFRRRRRRPALDLSSLERTLDRVVELVERIVELIPDLVPAREGGSRPPPAVSPAPFVSAPVVEPDGVPDGFVLFVGEPTGYRLLERAGPPPERAGVYELDGAWYAVLRLGPSPLPGDRRRCAFLERQEPSRAERTSGPMEAGE